MPYGVLSSRIAMLPRYPRRAIRHFHVLLPPLVGAHRNAVKFERNTMAELACAGAEDSVIPLVVGVVSGRAPVAEPL